MDWLDEIKWDAQGLVPVIAQEAGTNDVLMFAWMNRESLQKTAELGRAVYYSRSRGKLWFKGEESGHVQTVHEIRTDCDSDVVLLMSPLGQGLAELARDAGGARLTQPNQAVIIADSLPQLAQRVFGAPLPLDTMADWLRGARPALSGEVDGWRVVISETSAYRQHRLLRVIEARREDVEFKLIVDDWDVQE